MAFPINRFVNPGIDVDGWGPAYPANYISANVLKVAGKPSNALTGEAELQSGRRVLVKGGVLGTKTGYIAGVDTTTSPGNTIVTVTFDDGSTLINESLSIIIGINVSAGPVIQSDNSGGWGNQYNGTYVSSTVVSITTPANNSVTGITEAQVSRRILVCGGSLGKQAGYISAVDTASSPGNTLITVSFDSFTATMTNEPMTVSFGIPADKHVIPGAGYYVFQQINITANTTIAKPVHIMPGGSFNISSGVYLYIDAPLYTSNRQIFYGPGQIFLSKKTGLSTVHVSWFGGVPDNSTDNFNAIEAAFKCAYGSMYNANGPTIVEFSSGIYLSSGPHNLTGIGRIGFRGATPVTHYNAQANTTTLRSTGTWTGYFFNAANDGNNKYEISFENLMLSMSKTQMQGGIFFGSQCNMPIIKHCGSDGAGLCIIKSQAESLRLEGGYYNSGHMLDVDDSGAALTSYAGAIELHNSDWCISNTTFGHDSPTSGSTGLIAALLLGTLGNQGGGQATNVVLEQADYGLVATSSVQGTTMFSNLRVELMGKEGIIIDGTKVKLTNVRLWGSMGSRSAGTYDAIRITGTQCSINGLTNEITSDVRHLINDQTTTAHTHWANTYIDIPSRMTNNSTAQPHVTGNVMNQTSISNPVIFHPIVSNSVDIDYATYPTINADAVRSVKILNPPNPVIKIDNGVVGQDITLMFAAGVTLSHAASGGNLRLKSGADTAISANTMITFRKWNDGNWYQL